MHPCFKCSGPFFRGRPSDRTTEQAGQMTLLVRIDADADAGSGELGSYAEVDPSVSPPNNDILVSYNIEGKVGGVGEFEAHFVVVEW